MMKDTAAKICTFVRAMNLESYKKNSRLLLA
jgi:hypothetical protein